MLTCELEHLGEQIVVAGARASMEQQNRWRLSVAVLRPVERNGSRAREAVAAWWGSWEHRLRIPAAIREGRAIPYFRVADQKRYLERRILEVQQRLKKSVDRIQHESTRIQRINANRKRSSRQLWCVGARPQQRLLICRREICDPRTKVAAKGKIRVDPRDHQDPRSSRSTQFRTPYANDSAMRTVPTCTATVSSIRSPHPPQIVVATGIPTSRHCDSTYESRRASPSKLIANRPSKSPSCGSAPAM